MHPSACRVNTFICTDSSEAFSFVNPWLKFHIVKHCWLTVSWNWRCFWDYNYWMLYFLHNRIERTVAFTATGVWTFWLANSNKILFRLTTKYCFFLVWLALCFRCDIIFWKYQHKKVIWIKSGKSLACWKRLTESRRHCGALVGLAPQKNSKPLQIETGNIIDQRNFC